MIEYGARGEPADHFAAWLAHDVSDADRDARVLRETYETMRRLQEEGRNHIWGYVARNLARPVWLASEAQKADVVIGNPPWVSYRYMRGDFKARFRQESRAANLWVGGKVATQQDLSAYFSLRAAGLYLRRGGRLAMIVPHAALSRQSYAPFRTGTVARFGQPVFHLRFTQAWAFGPEVAPLFPVPSCVLFAEVHPDVDAPRLPKTIRAFRGTLPKRDADVAEAETNLTETAAPWPTIAAAGADGSPYRKIFQNGATLFPRRLVLVDLVSPSGRLPPNPEFPFVRRRTGNQDKPPWKTVPPPEGTVEKRFLRSVLLGESIAPFRIVAQQPAVVPWDEAEGRLMDAARAAQRGYRKLAQWLEKNEALWTRHKQSDLSFLEQLDYLWETLRPISGRADTGRVHEVRHQPRGLFHSGRNSGRRFATVLGVHRNQRRSALLVRDSQQRNVTHLRSTIPSPRPVGRATFRQIRVQPAYSAFRARQCGPPSLGRRRTDRGRRGPRRSLQRGRVFHPHAQTHPQGPGRTRRGRRNRPADRATPRRHGVGASSPLLRRGPGGFGPPLHRQPPPSALSTLSPSTLTDGPRLDMLPYFIIIGNMENENAVNVLAALAQETRLAIFRLLVRAGEPGLAAGTIGETLGIPAATLSFHLKELKHAQAIRCRREGRSLIYRADFGTMTDLLGFLTAHCCRGIDDEGPGPEGCGPDC